MAAVPLLTIGVTTFKMGPKVRWGLDALVEQTAYTKGQASLFEVLVVDDSSPDDTYAIVSEVAAGMPNWTVHQLAENSGGASRPRNWVLDHASGEYVMFVDGDDRLWPEAVERLLVVINDYDPDFVGLRVWSEDRRGIARFSEAPNLYDAPLVGTVVGFQSLPGRMVRRSIIGEIRFPEDVRIGEDRLFYAAIRVGQRHRLGRIVELNDYPYYQQADSAPGQGLIATTQATQARSGHKAELIAYFAEELLSAPADRALGEYTYWYLDQLLYETTVWNLAPKGRWAQHNRAFWGIIQVPLERYGAVFDATRFPQPHVENIVRCAQAGLTYDEYLAVLHRAADLAPREFAEVVGEERGAGLMPVADLTVERASGNVSLRLNVAPYLGVEYLVSAAEIDGDCLRLGGVVQSPYLAALGPEAVVSLVMSDMTERRCVCHAQTAFLDASTAEPLSPITTDLSGAFAFAVDLRSLAVGAQECLVLSLQLGRDGRGILRKRLRADDLGLPPTMFKRHAGPLGDWYHVDHLREGLLEFAWYLTGDGYIDLHVRKPGQST